MTYKIFDIIKFRYFLYKVNERSGIIINKQSGKKLISFWITLGIILLCILIYIFLPNIKGTVDLVISYLVRLDLEGLKEYILSFGAWAPVMSFLLMILQSVAAPLPSFVITFANAALFGWVMGAILSWSSAMAGAVLCFYIARFLGRDTVEKLTSKFALKSVDEFFNKYGKHTILIARLLPFMSFDLVSYAAGLTSMSFISFFIATGLGQLPATIVYSYVGGMLTGGVKLMMMGILTLFAISIFIYMLKKVYNDGQVKQN
ncbi:TVP38/TMEM64 family protein [Clostridium sp. CCUG 7971]|nr:TVP38/TMEM64 family protein [Clostridium sp. CCUG 7971]